MAFAVGISFLTGRFHATPWGRHVNEGATEWPPSPWRLLRALVATWKIKFGADQEVSDLMPQIFGKLVQPPVFKLPSATLGHTRHFMPWHKKWAPEQPQKSRTLVFDSFVAVSPSEEVVCVWPDVQLDNAELVALSRVLSEVAYLGRAESWTDLRVVESPAGGQINCMLANGEALSKTGQHEPVLVLCPDSEGWNQWGFGKKVARPDPQWNLLAETGALNKEGWSRPPGSLELTYLRPLDAFAVRPHVRSSKRERVKAARYALDATVLPPLTETIYIAEIARRRIQGIFGRLFEGRSSPVLSGKHLNGKRVDGHRHAFFLPTDENGDGKVDHLTVIAEDGFSLEYEGRALDKFAIMHSPRTGADIRLVLLGLEDSENLESIPILSRSVKWRSVTPFVPTRHYKKRGRKRDTCHVSEFPETVLLEELERRSFPEPSCVRRLERCELWNHSKEIRNTSMRSLSWLKFRRERVHGEGSRGLHPGCGFEIEFSQAVRGPIAVGYGCHFGLGLFAPVA